MSSFTGHTRRGAKARRMTNQPAGRITSPKIQQEHHHKPSQDHGSPKKGVHQSTSMARPDRTWADAARDSPGNIISLTGRYHIFHTIAKVPGFPYPFASNPHLLITCICSGSTDNHNELVFIHVYPSEHAATRGLLQRYRTEAHAAIRKRLVIDLF